MTSKSVLLISMSLTSCLWTSGSFAIDHYPLITYQCDQTKDIVLITSRLLKGGEEKTFKFSDADGTYNAWDLVKIKDNTIIDSSTIIKDCVLSTGQYRVVLEPQIFNHDLAGFCGANISVAITVLKNNVEIMERKPFEFHCSGNTKIITGVKIMGSSGDIKIRDVPRHEYY
ncbi:MAG: hypothetical protein OEZ15_09000 [Gammaproteobacteria bacterium]|nr:hypothetical protein [Gammaproteobacteria bacterium]